MTTILKENERQEINMYFKVRISKHTHSLSTIKGLKHGCLLFSFESEGKTRLTRNHR